MATEQKNNKQEALYGGITTSEFSDKLTDCTRFIVEYAMENNDAVKSDRDMARIMLALTFFDLATQRLDSIVEREYKRIKAENEKDIESDS